MKLPLWLLRRLEVKYPSPTVKEVELAEFLLSELVRLEVIEPDGGPKELTTYKEFERAYWRDLLKNCDSNVALSCKLAGVSRHTVYRKINEFSIILTKSGGRHDNSRQ